MLLVIKNWTKSGIIYDGPKCSSRAKKINLSSLENWPFSCQKDERSSLSFVQKKLKTVQYLIGEMRLKCTSTQRLFPVTRNLYIKSSFSYRNGH